MPDMCTSLDESQRLSDIRAERLSRGYVYVVADKYRQAPLLVTQNLHRVARHLVDKRFDDVKASSLYDACQREAPYKHRWHVTKLRIDEDPASAIEHARSKQKQDVCILGSSNFVYHCVPAR